MTYHNACVAVIHYGDEPGYENWQGWGIDADGFGADPMFLIGRCTCGWKSDKHYIGEKATPEDQLMHERWVERLCREHNQGKRP